jgi:Reverse transcriptase (RNA-dependent DNA polymerase)
MTVLNTMKPRKTRGRAKLQTNGTIFNKQTQILAYADDIAIIGRSQTAVRDAYLALEREVNKVGLKINESKTKYMIAAGPID